MLPSRKATLPVGVALTALETVAVNVTCCPTVTVAAEDATAVEVAACCMVWLTACELLAAKVASPEYFAVIKWVPAARDEELNIACALAFSVPVPIWVVPSRNAAVPVGVPLPVFGLSVAVNVTGCPKVVGFAEDVSAVEVARRTLSFTAVEVLAANPAEGEGR
jgi:hypothetical protein